MRCAERQQTTRADILARALCHPTAVIQKKRQRPTATLVKKGGPVKKGAHIRFILKTDSEWAEAKRMADEQIARTNNAIQELKNELKRMHGGIVDTDYNTSTLRVDAWKQYSLDPQVLASEVVDDESNTCSSEVD